MKLINFYQCSTKALSAEEIFETFDLLWKQKCSMSHYACVTLRGHQFFPAQVLYLTFLQHILRIRSGKVSFWNSKMEDRIYAKFLQNQYCINITGTCRIKVFSRRNSYNKCLNIWTYNFSRISHCGFVILRY